MTPLLTPLRRRRTARRTLLAVATAIAASALLIISQLPASAITVGATPTPVTGNATHFDGLGQPYGGCGIPQPVLDSQNFVALNVYNTPNDYSFYPRPITAGNADKIGMWDNGLNCGRWVQVTIGDICTGTNDGAPGQPFCRNGSFVSDAYNGATLNMLVADSCGDSNAWCRDDPYHLDLVTSSLNQFVKNGAPVGDMDPNHWNNRHVQWQFMPAPNYTGDIQIGFLQGAQQWWPAIAVSHLANGIHGIDYLANGAWVAAPMDSDMGQAYIIGGTSAGGSQFQIRVHDANDTMINNGRVYSFSLPTSCGTQCSPAYTQVTYTTSGSTASPSPSASASRTPSASPTPSRTPSASPSRTPSASPSRTPSASPSRTPSAPPSSPAVGGCRVTESVDSAWSGGFQATFTVTNGGSTALTSWGFGFGFPGTQTLASSWNATMSQSGSQVTATNAAYNGNLAPGASTTVGAVINGANAPLVNLRCA
jgi:hypothetical protein